MAPTNDTTELADSIERNVSIYKSLLSGKREEWIENVPKLVSAFEWGFNVGTLIPIAEDNPKELRRVSEKLTQIRDDVNKFYEDLVDNMDLKQLVVSDSKVVVQTANELIADVARMLLMMDSDSANEFEEKCRKLDPFVSLTKLENFEAPVDLEKGTKLLYFFSFHLASLAMYRIGLLMALQNVDVVKKETEMNKQLLEIFSHMGKLFENLAVARVH